HYPGVRVLNAGDGQHQHPTQALLDLFTLAVNHSGSLEGLAGVKVAIVGDILHSRVARSNMQALTTVGAEVHVAGPPTLVPLDFAQWGVKVHWQLQPALQGARFVMALRLQQERMQGHFLPSLREYHQCYGLTLERLQVCDPQVQVLHPGPVNRGVELASEVMESPCCLVDQQVSHGVAVRMAVLYLLGGGAKHPTLESLP
ncbi:MAG: aspartate carbamoyltransferase catalytic subunit, partial [Thermostichales cyanobacterium DRC_bins_46]